jgi:hypothetical protein
MIIIAGACCVGVIGVKCARLTASSKRLHLKLLTIGAVMIGSMRRYKIMIRSACPHQDLFRAIALCLNTSQRPG